MENERESKLREDFIYLTGIQLSEKENYQVSLSISRAISAFLNYCNLTEVPASADNSILDYALAIYNRNGSEGLQSESYSGISQTFQTGIPDYIKKEWNRFRRLKTL